jgi:hypothetical protein
LNFGYFYESSPVIAYDGEQHPAYTMGQFTSSTVPGCRTPHFWLRDGLSLYDTLGQDFTLIRFDPAIHVSGIVEAAERRNFPLSILDVEGPEAQTLYACKLALVRPDQHVAWRGDNEPPDPTEVIDLVRGARRTLS